MFTILPQTSRIENHCLQFVPFREDRLSRGWVKWAAIEHYECKNQSSEDVEFFRLVRVNRDSIQGERLA